MSLATIIICAIYIAIMGWLAWEFGTAPICDEDDQ